MNDKKWPMALGAVVAAMVLVGVFYFAGRNDGKISNETKLNKIEEFEKSMKGAK